MILDMIQRQLPVFNTKDNGTTQVFEIILTFF
jgi:hypothetical protein